MNNVNAVRIEKMPDGTLILYIIIDDDGTRTVISPGVLMKLGHFDPKSDNISYLFSVPDDYKTEQKDE